MFKSSLIALTLLASCIGGGSDPAPPECTRDDDCTKFSNPCNTSVCRSESCTSQPVVCNDDNVCTNDRCDITRGCVFETEVGKACEVGSSGVCEGMIWHPEDTCDASGACVDSGSMDCNVGTGNACVRATCDGGCTMVDERNGTPCVAGGRSDTCVDDELYFSDFCDGGVCAEAGKERCPDSFCQRGRCAGDECGTVEVGLGIDLTGAWNAFGLIEDGTLVTTRTGIELTDNGVVDVVGQLGSLGAETPSSGEYCVATDRTMQIAFDYQGRRRTFSGRVSPGRDIAFFAPDQGQGTLVLVRNRETSEARLAGGAYRVMGFDTVIRNALPIFEALQGTFEFKNHCVASGAYRLGNGGVDVPVVIPDPPSCLKFEEGFNAVSFDVRAQGDVHVLAGVVGTGGNYLVMQRFRVGERLLEPSLLVFVRTALSTASAFEGDYAFTRLDAGVQLTTSSGALTLDGAGGITDFVDGTLSLPPGTTGSMQSLAEAAYVSSVELGGETYERSGQLGQTTFDRVDWFVDVATSNGLISGRSLRLGMREN